MQPAIWQYFRNRVVCALLELSRNTNKARVNHYWYVMTLLQTIHASLFPIPTMLHIEDSFFQPDNMFRTIVYHWDVNGSKNTWLRSRYPNKSRANKILTSSSIYEICY